MNTDILNDLNSLKNEFEKGKENLELELAETLLKDLKALTPVDTGRLRDSYAIKKNRDGIEVVNDCEYAPFVDLGHSTKGGSFIAGKHMYDKSLLKLESKASMKITDFLERINSF